MTRKIDLLTTIIERIGFGDAGDGVYFFHDEVKQWPANTLEHLINLKLIRPAQQYRDTITCDGCEDACFMPVTIYPTNEERTGKAFIACDQRDDIGRVSVEFERLKQWHSAGDDFAAILPNLLKITAKPNTTMREGNQWSLGLLKSKKGNAAITLKIAHGLMLHIAEESIPLQDILSLNRGKLVLNKTALEEAANEALIVETPEQRRQRLQKRVDALKTKGVRSFLRQTAKEENISTTRLKIILNPKHGESTLQNVWAPVTSKKSKVK